MRSYGQYCGVARTLDVVGDRWSLLIVRELLIRDCRWTDLRAGLPGVATNLLADRLRELEDHGILEHEDAGPAPVYRLTARGRELAPVLRELGRWAIPLMSDGPGEDDAVRTHWLAIAADTLLSGGAAPPMRIAIDARGEALTVDVADDGTVDTTFRAAPDADVRLTGDPPDIVMALAGLRRSA